MSSPEIYFPYNYPDTDPSNDPDTKTLTVALKMTGEQQMEGVDGDVNGDGIISLEDAITALQVLSGINSGAITDTYDIDGDGKLGLTEIIYILEKIVGARE